jgi:hypothetical protein
MYTDPLWLEVTCLLAWARRRARAALGGDAEHGALSLEWVIIAAIIGAIALAVGAVLVLRIKAYEQKIP